MKHNRYTQKCTKQRRSLFIMFEFTPLALHRSLVYRQILTDLMSRFSAEELSLYHAAVSGVSGITSRSIAYNALARWSGLVAAGEALVAREQEALALAMGATPPLPG